MDEFLSSLFSHYKIMQNFYFMGIDVSKKKLDICVIQNSKVLVEEQVCNHPQAIASVIKEIMRELAITNDQLIVCAEHTGQYTYPLICSCKALQCKLWLENASQIKYCSGVTRGKNDKVDAKRIAQYAMRFIDNLKTYDRPSEELTRLKQLEAERTLYISDLTKYKAQLTDQQEFMEPGIFKRKAKRLKEMINYLDKILKDINKEMAEIIASSKLLAHQMKLLTSIEGIGQVIAMNMIIATEAFTRFNNPRQFSCYVGVAPFAYTSGTSIHSRNRVSHRAVKYLKCLLHLAAIAILHKKSGDLKSYFERKFAEGKNKMTILNAIRAKLVARMFAVIRNDRIYQPILSF